MGQTLTNTRRLHCYLPLPRTSGERSTLGTVSDAARQRSESPHGTDLLPRDLTLAELDAAPLLTSLDQLLIEDLTDEEADAFAAAIAT